MKFYFLLCLLGMPLLCSSGLVPLRADGAAPADDGSLVDLKKDSTSGQLAFDGGAGATIDSQAGAIKCTYPAGQGYPAVKISDPSGLWNLTGYTGVEAVVTNTGTMPVKVALRIDGGDKWQDSPWDCESVDIPPGETKTIHVTFGQSFGKPGFEVPPDHVLRALVFVADPQSAMTLSVTSLKAVK